MKVVIFSHMGMSMFATGRFSNDMNHHEIERQKLNEFARKYCMDIHWFSEYHCRIEGKLNVWTSRKYKPESEKWIKGSETYEDVEELLLVLDY